MISWNLTTYIYLHIILKGPITVKKYKIISLTLGTALLLCSCQKNTTEAILSEIPNHITKKLEANLNIDADIIIPEKIQSEIEILEVELTNLDAEDIISTLYPNSEKLYEDLYIYEDGTSIISMSDGNYFYDNKNERIYSRFFMEQEELLFPNTPNIEDLDMEKSLEEATSYLSSIGLNNIELNKYYVLNKTFLESQYNAAKKEANWQEDVDAGREVLKEDWGAEKGAYLFNFEAIENGLPIAQAGYFTKDNEYVAGTSIKICCSENGITYVESNNIYTLKTSDGSKKLTGIETLTEGLEYKFSNLIIQEPIIINKIRLVYQAQKIKNKIYLIPVWEVQYSEQCEGIIEKGTIYFDTETGKEIVIY